jgi:hypothetical protein
MNVPPWPRRALSVLVRWTRLAANVFFNLARRTVSFFGIDDPAVAFVLGGNVWIGLFSLVQVGLIAGRLTIAEQAVNFNCLTFFQVFLLLDFGFSTVLQQLVSHQRAFLHEEPPGVLAGPAGPHARLASLLPLAARWYVAVILLGTAVVLPAGWVFFAGLPELAAVDWHVAWVLTVLTACGALVATGLGKFMSGCGDILPVTRVTTGQLMAVSFGYCAVLAAGGKLFAFPGSQLCGLVIPAIYFLAVRRPLLAALWGSPRDPTLTWYNGVRPFQSRIALSLISLQASMLMVPAATRCFGAEAGGRLGMTLAVTAALQMLGLGWLETRVPVFGHLAAKKNWPELDRVYRHVLWKSTTFLAGILGVVVAANVALNRWPHPALAELVSRFLPPVPLALLALVTLVTHVFFVRAAYLRAHCKEPYLIVTVLQSLALVGTIAVAGRYGTLEAMLGGYLFWAIVLGQGLGWWIFHVKRREWHSLPTS